MNTHARTPLRAVLGFACLGTVVAPAVSRGDGAVARLDSTLRFRNAAVVTAVSEPHLLPRPAERAFLRSAYYFDAIVGRRSVRALSSKKAGRALGVNALDEVPDSSWFENRIGARPVTPQELRQRPFAEPRPPFAVVGMKEGGTSVGVRVRDANGARYLLKFELVGDRSGEVSADLVVQRLLWAVGYHTAEDTIQDVRVGDLQMDPRAKMKNVFGDERPMTAADLRRELGRAVQRRDGSYRGLFSRLLDGIPIGGFPQEGTRADDPNDAIPHEDRRDVRGARIFFSWLNHVDIKEDNVLDTWIEEPGPSGRGRVRHYLVDFGNSMGMFGWPTDQTAGFAHVLDLGQGIRSLVSLGMWQRPWEGMQPSGLPGVGNLESARFDPAAWREQYPWAPFERFDRFDAVWGARILMRLTPAHIAAAVAEGRYDDPRSAAYVTQTLIERQRKIGRHYLVQASPLESFAVTPTPSGARLCFDDPLLVHFGEDQPALAAGTLHTIATWDFDGRPLQARRQHQGATGVCLEDIAFGSTRDGYTIVDITTTRPGVPNVRILVHLTRTPETEAPRVIGLRRM